MVVMSIKSASAHPSPSSKSCGLSKLSSTESLPPYLLGETSKWLTSQAPSQVASFPYSLRVRFPCLSWHWHRMFNWFNLTKEMTIKCFYLLSDTTVLILSLGQTCMSTWKSLTCIYLSKVATLKIVRFLEALLNKANCPSPLSLGENKRGPLITSFNYSHQEGVHLV